MTHPKHRGHGRAKSLSDSHATWLTAISSLARLLVDHAESIAAGAAAAGVALALGGQLVLAMLPS